jgi:hypothetical protein
MYYVELPANLTLFRLDDLRVAAFTKYMRSEDHRTSHGRISPTLNSVIKLERLDHLHTYDVVAT